MRKIEFAKSHLSAEITQIDNVLYIDVIVNREVASGQTIHTDGDSFVRMKNIGCAKKVGSDDYMVFASDASGCNSGIHPDA